MARVGPQRKEREREREEEEEEEESVKSVACT